MSGPILPSATIGVLGSGQLGRMFALAARRLGYRVAVFSPDAQTPAGQVADREWVHAYDDLDAVAEFARSVDVMTLEFENVPAATVAQADRYTPVRPGGAVLEVAQHRLREKRMLHAAGFPVTPFQRLSLTEATIDPSLTPGVLKTAAFGYDGKGQAFVASVDECQRQWDQMGRVEAILEQRVDFAKEISVIAARGVDGSVACYAPIENDHAHHILDVSQSPAPIGPKTAQEAAELACAIVTHLELIGVLCVEMFLTPDHRLLVNELAPRPHNSGHLTIDAHVTCQFEQQLRAVCGLPLGSTEQRRPAAMANLLGDLWFPNSPNWQRLLELTDVKLHLYGKQEPKRRRKMGHLTTLASTLPAARNQVLEARQRLIEH